MKQYSNRNTIVMGITRNQKQQDPYSAAAQTILAWLSEHLWRNEYTWSGVKVARFMVRTSCLTDFSYN